MSKILVINPGSTSTKLSLFDDETEIETIDIFHDSSILKEFKTINDQLDYRMAVVYDFLNKHHIDKLDAIASRGGASYSVEGGTYEVDDLLIEDTKAAKGGLYHSSMLGVQMAKVTSERFGGHIYMSNPTVTDEYEELSRVTGIDGIYRKSICHALNQKAVAQRFAEDTGNKYEDLRLIVAHIDGGITVMAHKYGRMIDGNDGGGGDGPLTPTRMGSMAISDVINYLWDKPKDEMLKLISVSGGFSNYFGTSNSDIIHDMVLKGDKKAKRVYEAMIYQTAKCIGAMSIALEGQVDAIILTGGLLRFKDIYESIQRYCGWIAKIYVYPGEYEQYSLAHNGYLALNQKIEVKHYCGKPVFDGFND